MEALLSLAFDNLSSYSADKIRKGLRQVEGLLAQICLSKNSPSSAAPRRPAHARTQSTPNFKTEEPPPIKSLAELPADPAFREFFKLQEGFEWNVALRLVNTLDRLMGKSNDGQNDLLIIKALDLIQGILLLHPPSRTLFQREVYMNHLLDLLEPINCPAIQSSTLLTLVTALLASPTNTRVFEKLDGLLTVTSLFKSRSTSREVKLKLVEFLYFYLMPENPSVPSPRTASKLGGEEPEKDTDGPLSMLKRSPSKVGGGLVASPVASKKQMGGDSLNTKTTEEKQALLGRYLSSVDNLVADLRESTPFGGVVC